jgi:hypothetical protein
VTDPDKAIDKPPERADETQLPARSEVGHADGADTMPPAVRSYLESRRCNFESIADADGLGLNGDHRESKPSGPLGPPKDLEIEQSIAADRWRRWAIWSGKKLALVAVGGAATYATWHWLGMRGAMYVVIVAIVVFMIFVAVSSLWLSLYAWHTPTNMQQVGFAEPVITCRDRSSAGQGHGPDENPGASSSPGVSLASSRTATPGWASRRRSR